MAEMVIGEKVTLEEMGGAKMHCSVSGVGDVLVKAEQEALAFGRRHLTYFPPTCHENPPPAPAKPPKHGPKTIEQIVPPDQNKFFDMYEVINELVDEGSWCELKKLWAPEMVTGLCRIESRVVGIVASQPKRPINSV